MGRAARGLLLASAPPLLLLLSSLAAASEPWVKLQVGTTRLTDLGAYRVSYHLAGGKRVGMPVGWSGHFTEDVGIAFYDAGTHDGRRAHVLHSPWKAGHGSVTLEYFVELPDRKPVTLRFGIAMRPDIVEKSDGVTFSAFTVADGKRTEVAREHYAQSAWKDFSADLSAHAGKQVIVGFQTEPGPKNSPSWDFSMLGEPRVTVEKDIDTRGGLVEEILASKAYKTASALDLTPLANRSGQYIFPTTPVPHKASAVVEGSKGVLRYEGEDCTIEYRVPTDGRIITGITARVDGGPVFHPCAGGGIQIEDPDRPGRLIDAGKADPTLVHSAAGPEPGIHITAVYDTGSKVYWLLRMRGKALVISVVSEDRRIARLSLGQPLNRGMRRGIRIPYLTYGEVFFLRPQNVYTLSYLDWRWSYASRTPGNEAIYLPNNSGKRNMLQEDGYIAVSPTLAEVLPNCPHPPSPYLDLLGPKIMLDIWGGTYDQGAELLRSLKTYGVDHAAVIWHNWQRYGYDVKLPDHLPANPRLGGDEAMKRLAAAARDVGYPFSLHENYIDFYPDAPSWEPKDVVMAPDGKFSNAWYHPGTKVQSFAMKASRMLHYAKQNSPEIHRRFGTTAAYLDVHTCVPPWHHVDFDPKTEGSASFRPKLKAHGELFQFERDTHGGPLFGEGNRHYFWAGLVDGVEAQVEGGEDTPLLVEFDLLKLHPQMVNHGMGYYTRWLRTGRETKWNVEAPTPAQMDKYRATELAYGHAGFVGAQVVYNPYFVVREHNLVAPVQTLYGTAKAKTIHYEVNGQFVTISAALAVDALDRLRVTYDSGLVLHVNMGKSDWAVDGHVLPQYGWLAKGPKLLAYTAKRDGVIVDYAENDEFVFADARSHVFRPWEQNLLDLEPRLAGFRHLGDGRCELTYEWVVGQELGADQHCFVHFVDPSFSDGDDIRFQGDHALNPPTSQWRKGTTVKDGPHAVTVPADQETGTVDVVIGLYRRDGPRLRIRGVDTGQERYLIGRLAITREGAQVHHVRLLDVGAVAANQGAKRRVFDERMNLAGKTIDFGSLRTNGSVKLYKRRDAWRLLPYPRNKAFDVALDLRLFGAVDTRMPRVSAADAKGKFIARVERKVDEKWIEFKTGTPGTAEHRLTFPTGR